MIARRLGLSAAGRNDGLAGRRASTWLVESGAVCMPDVVTALGAEPVCCREKLLGAADGALGCGCWG